MPEPQNDSLIAAITSLAGDEYIPYTKDPSGTDNVSTIRRFLGGNRVDASTASAASSVTLDISDTNYRSFMLFFYDVTFSGDGTDLYGRCSISSTIQTGANYQWQRLQGDSSGTTPTSTGNGAATFFTIASNVGNASNEGVTGIIWVNNPHGTTLYKGIRSRAAGSRLTNVTEGTLTAGHFTLNTSAWDGFALLPASGTFSGEFEAYGIAGI